MSIRVFFRRPRCLASGRHDAASAEILPTPPGWQIERAVLVNRHGVRSPTAANEELDKYSATPWPTWPVEPGFLSPRGEELMRLMGGYYRVLYGGRGLVQADDCPAVGTVAAWTDLRSGRGRRAPRCWPACIRAAPICPCATRPTSRYRIPSSIRSRPRPVRWISRPTGQPSCPVWVAASPRCSATTPRRCP